ncbi:cytochrome P450 CYP736A12-like [Senna tora]|uniref:Cytochrome P450 CYP736A12-like n=1 Tax=Senna tora TaxID=362788 RepID=A0A834T3J2_9FABA|nr:cytochrome P450 CYP736A12-like [Senna tora]
MHRNDTVVYDRTHIKAIALDMIAAAFETSATVIVWALSELLRNPRVMKALKHELRRHAAETFRLHPAGSLLPREAIEDARVGEWWIEKGTRVIVNVWAMGRDRSVWSENAEEFWPERFEEREVDFRGRESLMFVPFGSGRRGCPGIHLGLSTVKLVVAQMVHCFEWELPGGMGPEELDMGEKFGLSMPKAEHLLAVPSMSKWVDLAHQGL